MAAPSLRCSSGVPNPGPPTLRLLYSLSRLCHPAGNSGLMEKSFPYATQLDVHQPHVAKAQLRCGCCSQGTFHFTEGSCGWWVPWLEPPGVTWGALGISHRGLISVFLVCLSDQRVGSMRVSVVSVLSVPISPGLRTEPGFSRCSIRVFNIFIFIWLCWVLVNS